MAGKAVRWTALTILAIAAIEVALQWLWPYVDGNDPVPTLEEQLAVVAALAVAAVPHVIAVFGYRGRPVLLKVAGVVALILGTATLAMFTLALVGVPLLLVPGFFYLLAPAADAEPGRFATPVLAVVAAFCALGAAACFFMTEDARCTVTVESGGTQTTTPYLCGPEGFVRLSGDVVASSGTSDAVVFHESIPSLALSVAAVAFAVWGSAPVDRREPQPAV